MRILRVEVEPLQLRLREPYTIAYETVDSVENLLVRLITDGPHVGLGIAAPDQGVTGETAAVAEGALREVAAPLLMESDPLRRGVVVEQLAAQLAHAPSARAAVDMALHDLLGKQAGLPVWRMLGGYRSGIPTSITLYLTETEEMVRRARAFAAKGFQALKLKGGANVDLDVERVHAVRAAVGPALELRFDANQGYDPATAVDFHRRTLDANLSMFEQPTAAARLKELRHVTQNIPIPVMADESILNLADAFRYARGEAMDMVNLKLVKVGGLDAALQINAVARAAGLEVMVGCMDEVSLSIASGVAFALSRKNVEFADLDGHLDLIGDPTEGALTLRDGVLYPSEEPGFGLVDAEPGR
ncbi:MAG: L-alanine-DL-glutamate epimerase-like enolase superfamily enzyme [Myxococcota bacterium]|jgi:L-alanine-DL-glutamate epimerase-like enolase superfamily enzyme